MDTEYLTRFPDGTLVRWKPLTWEEYRYLVKTFGESLEGAAGWLLCEAAAALCILDHDQDGQQVEPSELYAGTVYTVGREIIELTGFVPTVENVRNSLAKAREKVTSDWYESALAIVCATFRLDEEVVRKFTHRKFMEFCARVEIVTGQPMSVVDPAEEEAKQIKKFRIGPDGQKIPIITKQDLRRRGAMNMQPVPGPND
jgi:hypothetical protein